MYRAASNVTELDGVHNKKAQLTQGTPAAILYFIEPVIAPFDPTTPNTLENTCLEPME